MSYYVISSLQTLIISAFAYLVYTSVPTTSLVRSQEKGTQTKSFIKSIPTIEKATMTKKNPLCIQTQIENDDFELI